MTSGDFAFLGCLFELLFGWIARLVYRQGAKTEVKEVEDEDLNI
jgi:hypothetical protein